ncbi:MAG: 3-deoxy-D-manno-octulosonic acid transferase [Burkholderiales bacterium PBB6]|nr:MAG: 3-deoxy-D-manno-octulosonic acid transferase [Burkholderiales bacterium PBB6]
MPVYLARLWWRGRLEPGYRHALPQRFGWGLPAVAPGAVWLHAVSLGETRAAAALVQALRDRRPGVRFIFTHGTATGREAGHALMQPGDVQSWLPFDTPGAVRRFLRTTQPAVGVLMETEIWPNLQQAARQQQVPMVLANARLSERSARKGERLSALMRPAAQALSVALAQTADDARRLRDAGVPKVEVVGNLKYDLQPPASQQALGQQWRALVQSSGQRPVLAVANTRDGEEAQLLAAWAELPAPRPLLLIVPRHPQRFDDVARMVDAAGFTLRRRSTWAHTPPADALGSDVDVWLGDSLGEMAVYYSLADVALLGGSFLPLGGHNLIEAAANGCPLVMGPSTFNFAEAAELALAAGAAQRAPDMRAALQAALAWLAAPASRSAAVQAAQQFAAAHRGAAARMAAAISAWL